MGNQVNSSELFDLSGRVALVTGGSRGIGRMIAEGFVGQGARVYISSRSKSDCVLTASELSVGDGECTALPVDLSTVEGTEALAAAYSERESTLDILVNNAGAAWAAELGEFPENGWDKVLDLNLKSPFFLTQALLPRLEAAAALRPAKVINIASVDGLHNNHWETYSYHASKGGLLTLTRRLAAQLAPRGVLVSAIAPGAFPSKMNRAARDSADAVARIVPVGRVGSAEDIAGAAIFLASRAGDYVVGDTLVVDGGVVNARLGPEVDPADEARSRRTAAA
jgi:NAD(P)-dependent dehydrogenase (short-subunit alcohol dehydrogenase family)